MSSSCRRSRLIPVRRAAGRQVTPREGEEPMQAMVSVIYRLVVQNDAQDLTEYGLLAAH